MLDRHYANKLIKKKKSLVSDILAGDGKIIYPFFTVYLIKLNAASRTYSLLDCLYVF